MAGEIEEVGAEADDAGTGRLWVKPQVQDMMAGAAELNGDVSVDGDPSLS